MLWERSGTETKDSVAAYFNPNPVVISKGIKGLEKKIREDKAIATAITMLRESLPDPMSQRIGRQYSFS